MKNSVKNSEHVTHFFYMIFWLRIQTNETWRRETDGHKYHPWTSSFHRMYVIMIHSTKNTQRDTLSIINSRKPEKNENIFIHNKWCIWSFWSFEAFPLLINVSSKNLLYNSSGFKYPMNIYILYTNWVLSSQQNMTTRLVCTF